MMMTFSICAVYSQHTFYQILLLYLQWNPSCEATSPTPAPEEWSFKRGGLSSGVQLNTFIIRSRGL